MSMSISMLRLTLLFVGVVLLTALLASDGRADPRDPFDFGPIPGTPSTPEGRAPAPPDTTPAPPLDDPISRELLDLAQWPDRVGVNAAESLLLRGDDVIPRLVDVLVADGSPSQPGAAWVLGRLGESAHVAAILRAAARRRNGSRAEVFFEAAYDLDPKRTKDWLFSFLPLRRPVFRQKATDFLLDYVSEEDRVRVLRLLDAPKAGVRVAGLRLLERAGVEDADERLFRALADPDPEVCRAASVLLALRADPGVLARLNSTAVEGHARERAYATLALVEVSRSSTGRAFEEQTLSELAGRRGLLHPEKLPRGTAAVGLAFGAQDSKDPNLAALLDRSVVDVLIDTVGGSHFRDFGSLDEPVFSALRRLSGLDLPATAVAWATWWRTERTRFQARRPLVKVRAEDLPFAWVRFDAVASDGGRRRVMFRSEDGTPQVGEFALPRGAFKALVDSLEASGIYDAEAAEQVRADEHVLVTVGVGNQKRRMAVPATEDTYQRFRLMMISLEEANVWQLYRDEDRWPNAAEWWSLNERQMSEADPETRVALLKAAIVHAYDDLPSDQARSEALDRIDDLMRSAPHIAKLDASEVRALAAAATASVSFGDLEVRALELAMDQEAATEARRDLVESLADRTEPVAADLLSRLLAGGGTEEIRSAFGDPRPGLRAAAARAARTLLETSETLTPTELQGLSARLQPGLEVLARDEDAHVAISAIVALDRLGAQGSADALERLYRAGDLGVKAAVADALGDLPKEEAWPFFSLILAEERDPEKGIVRANALRALARSGNEKSVNLLIFYLLNDPNRSVRVAAGDALADFPGEQARYAVIRSLTEGQPDPERRARLVDVLGRFPGDAVAHVLRTHLDDPDRTVSQVAALRLADHNAADAVPYLIEILKGRSPAMAQAARKALENVSCVRFELAGHDMLAEQYDRWYQTARITAAGEPDRAWLRDALRKVGYDVGTLQPYVGGVSDPVAVPLLIRALRDQDALLRRGAGIALERVTGLSMGKVKRTTSLRESGAVADQWARWWKRVQGPSED